VPSETTSSGACVAACAVSGHLDTRTAATEVGHLLHDELPGSCDLAFVFASYHHRAALPEAVDTIRRTVDPSIVVAVTTEGVLGSVQEMEGVAGMSAMSMRLPGVRLAPWTSTPDDPMSLTSPAAVAERIGFGEDFRTTILLGDPFSTPITKLLPALTSCGGADRAVPVIGGMASGASQSGQNTLIVNDQVVTSGAIGVTVAGDIEVDFVVSQGCRPIGTPFVVTKTNGNVVLELGGRPALDVLQEIASELTEPERNLLQKGLLLGHVIDERKRPFGRGSFLVRSLLGFDRENKGVVVGDIPRLGQTVQFHARDAVTAGEDLQLLLDAQVMDSAPFAGLLFTCNGRGRRLFGEPHHDVKIIDERLGSVPVAGFFAAGEIGPVGNQSFLHGHTASLGVFRAPAG
jgi:small ligand-binding sensory domain FIST